MSSHQKYNYNDCEYKQRWRNKCNPLLLAASLAIGAICHPQPENIGGEGRGPIRHNGERFPFPDLVCSLQPFLFSYYEGICRVSSCVSAIFSSLHFLQKFFFAPKSFIETLVLSLQLLASLSNILQPCLVAIQTTLASLLHSICNFTFNIIHFFLTRDEQMPMIFQNTVSSIWLSAQDLLGVQLFLSFTCDEKGWDSK